MVTGYSHPLTVSYKHLPFFKSLKSSCMNEAASASEFKNARHKT